MEGQTNINNWVECQNCINRILMHKPKEKKSKICSQIVLKILWTYGLSGKDYRVAALSKSYPTIKGSAFRVWNR